MIIFNLDQTKNSLTYIKPPKDANEVYYQMLGNLTIDMILMPTVPSVENRTGLLSVCLGSLKMISILSGIGVPKPRVFNFLHSFDSIIWILILLSFVVYAFFAYKFKRSWGQVLFFYSILFNQSNKLVLEKMERRYAILMGLWLFMTFFIYYCFHESLLTSILYETPEVVIDSVEEMAEFAIEDKLKKFYVLKGESAEGYIRGRDDLRSALLPLMQVVDIDEENGKLWDSTNYPLFATGEYAIISDDAYLDYKYVTKLSNYSSLYRGKEEIMSMPYFIALSENVSAQMRDDINIMYVI